MWGSIARRGLEGSYNQLLCHRTIAFVCNKFDCHGQDERDVQSFVILEYADLMCEE